MLKKQQLLHVFIGEFGDNLPLGCFSISTLLLLQPGLRLGAGQDDVVGGSKIGSLSILSLRLFAAGVYFPDC